MPDVSPSSDVEKQWKEHQLRIKQGNQELIDKNIFFVPDFFEDAVKSFPNQPCLWSVDTNECITYYEVQQRVNRVAHWARKKVNLPSGSVVGLMMTNCNDFLWLLLGLSKAGYVLSLFNTGFRRDLLHNAFTVSDVKFFIVERSVFCSLDASDRKWLDSGNGVIWETLNQQSCKTEGSEALQNYQHLLVSASSFISCEGSQQLEVPKEWCNDLSKNGVFCHKFTSGTKGKSKAAKGAHKRFIGIGVAVSTHMGLTKDDIYYVTLPLFHGNGGVVAVAAAWRAGSCLLIRSEFSASEFWNDVRNFKATATVYIGEMWQYICRGGRKKLVNEVDGQDERNHSLRVACGNCLRPELWREVQSRYGIPLIVEFYGQTEMPNAHPMMNSYGKVGACGFLPPDSDAARSRRLLDFNAICDEPVRVKKVIKGQNGEEIEFMSCVDAPIDEEGNQTGEVIIKLEGPYDGYTGEQDTQKVLYRDVFEPGDLWYHSGDLIKRNADGFYYFVDRLGDTFHCKGHNVSTNEVADALSQCSHVVEANVYGVEIPGGRCKGKIGMASLLLSAEKTGPAVMDEIRSTLHNSLPDYARPKFIRIVSQGNSKTATMKFQKLEFVADGFNPSKICPTDSLFIETNSGYATLTEEVFQSICRGDLTL